MSYGILFNRNKGNIVRTLSGMSSMLKMYGMYNTSATRDYVVVNAESGVIEAYYEGRKNDLPKICKDMEGRHIDEIAEGLLEALA